MRPELWHFAAVYADTSIPLLCAHTRRAASLTGYSNNPTEVDETYVNSRVNPLMNEKSMDLRWYHWSI
jgi:hypothetical protein